LNKKWVAALSVACGVVAAGGLYLRDQSGHELVRIIVASRDIPGREIVQAADLKEVMVPAAAVVKSAVQDESQLVGKMLLSAVYAGEQIRPQRVKPSPLELAPDEEAIAIQSDLVAAVGGLLQAGDVADVFLTVTVPNTKRVEVYKIGAAVRVLSVRDNNARATGPRANSDPAKQAGVPAVTMAVPSPCRAVARRGRLALRISGHPTAHSSYGSSPPAYGSSFTQMS
jgi:Flp pilus assembly protein CpaB